MEVVSVERNTIGDVPDTVPKDYIQTTKRRYKFLRRMKKIHWACGPFQKPEANSNDILINHDRAADPSIGDHFGAKLRTFDPTERYKYYRHDFCSINKHSPAKKMKIKKRDELVLVNGKFVPEMGHSDVLQLFEELPVDGKTPLCLVVTRKRKVRRRRWRWIKTVAVLASDEKDHKKGTIVKREKFRHSDKRAIYRTTELKMQVEGLTEYVSINPKVGISASADDDVDGDSTKIWQLDKMLVKNGKVNRWTALYKYYDNGKRWYINIGDSEVTISAKKQWMEVNQIGADVSFFLGEHYLAYNKHSMDFESKPKNFLDEHKDIYAYNFITYPISKDENREHSMDQPDCACAHTRNAHERVPSTSSLSSSSSSSSISSSEEIHPCSDTKVGRPSVFVPSTADGVTEMIDFSKLFAQRLGQERQLQIT